MREIAEAEVAMLGEIFQRFVEKSPIAVMVRGVLERVLGAEALDAWYERTAQKQYTRTLLFSTRYELMSAVVFAIKPSVHAAYQGREAEVGASIVSVYSKLKGIELQTSAELVRYSATALEPMGGAREPWLAGASQAYRGELSGSDRALAEAVARTRGGGLARQIVVSV